MERITNVFKEENFVLREYDSSKNVFNPTNRIELSVIDQSKIILRVNMQGEDSPTFVEAVLKLPEGYVGEVLFNVEAIGEAKLVCMDLSTKPYQIGKDVRLYSGTDSVSLNLKNDEYIFFKFTYYTNYDRAGTIKITCI